MSAAEKILLEALALPRDARTAVVAELIESLDSTDGLDAEWQAEMRRRTTAIRSGQSAGIEAQDVHRRIRESITRR